MNWLSSFLNESLIFKVVIELKCEKSEKNWLKREREKEGRIMRITRKKIKGYSQFHIGMRNIKTALAVVLCATIYFMFDRNPTFACIGAVFGMGSDMRTSKLGGGNRLFGTIIGGFIGMALFRIYIGVYPDAGHYPLLLLLVFVGIIVLIMMSQLIKWPGAIQPGSVMLCIILFNTPVETYIPYSLNRIFDTAIGVIVALAVNYFFPRERVVKWLETLRLRKKQME